MKLPALAIAVLATAATAANCPNDGRSAGAVRSVENRWVAALEQRDALALDCILDPAFTDTNWRGELVPKTEALERLSSRPPSTLNLSQIGVTLIGNVAIVRGVNTQTGASSSSVSVRFVDVFVYRMHRWRAVSAQESLIQTR